MRSIRRWRRKSIALVLFLATGGGLPLLAHVRAALPQGLEGNAIANVPGPSHRLAPRTKTSGCVRRRLPDRACSPGAYDPRVTQANIARAICVPGYSSAHRFVPESEKRAVYAEYGIRFHRWGQFEVDHIISLELGGSNDIADLYAEAAAPRPGFHEKDRDENFLHSRVCGGEIALRVAQRRIATNWPLYARRAGVVQ